MPLRPFRRLILPLCLVATLGLAACGGDDGGGGGESSADATELLEKAFKNQVESAVMSLEAEFQVDGVAQLEDGVNVKLSGPFQSAGVGKFPSLDWDISFSGAGQNLTAGATVTDDNAYVNFQGTDYEVGEELFAQFKTQFEQQAGDNQRVFAQLGIEPEKWLSDAEVESEDEDVAGEETTKITGQVDILKVIEDLGSASEDVGAAMGGTNPFEQLSDEDKQKIEDAIEDASVEIYVANDDETLRRFVLDVEFEIPEDLREQADGAEGGSAKLDISLSEVGEEQSIEAPANPQPLSNLLSQFGVGGESLFQ